MLAYMRPPLALLFVFIVGGCSASSLRSATPERAAKTLGTDHTPAVLVHRPPRGSGGIDADAAGWALFRRSEQLAACYDAAGGERAGTGIVYLILDVDPGGEVVDVMIGHSDVRGARFEGCLQEAIIGMVLPSAHRRSTLQAHLVFGASSLDEGRRFLAEYRSSRASARTEDGETAAVPLSNLRARIQSCYERVSRRQPGLRGRMVLELTVEEDGSVSDASVSGDDLDGSLNQCVLNAVRDLRLMGEYASAAIMRYPVILEPGR